MSFCGQLKKCVLNAANNSLAVILRSGVHSSGVLQKEGDRRSMMKGLPKTDEGSAGERFHFGGFDKVVDFPSLDTPNTLFDDIPFKELPILHIKSTKNNTIFALCRPDGHFILTRSCGMEGFKNCRKGTNVAAQVTAVGMSARITKMGYRTVRVCINGLGPGRLSSIKGLQTAGINIVSITDTTPICEIPIHRPPAARSV